MGDVFQRYPHPAVPQFNRVNKQFNRLNCNGASFSVKKNLLRNVASKKPKKRCGAYGMGARTTTRFLYENMLATPTDAATPWHIVAGNITAYDPAVSNEGGHPT